MNSDLGNPGEGHSQLNSIYEDIESEDIKKESVQEKETESNNSGNRILFD